MRSKTPKRKKRAARPAAGNLRTAQQLLQELDISESTFRRMVKAGLEAAQPGRGSAPALFDPVVVAKFIRQAGAALEDEDEDLMTGGSGDSVWLEKLRKEKALEAKRRNAIAEGRLVEIDEILKAVDVIFGALRAEFEALERLYGAAVGEAIRQAIVRAEATMKVKLPKPQGPIEGSQGMLAI